MSLWANVVGPFFFVCLFKSKPYVAILLGKNTHRCSLSQRCLIKIINNCFLSQPLICYLSFHKSIVGLKAQNELYLVASHMFWGQISSGIGFRWREAEG